MAKRRFRLERGGPKVLELRWRRGLRDFHVTLAGAGWLLHPDAVRAGATIALPGGSSLFVQVPKRPFWSVRFRDLVRVERDGIPVPGSDEDPTVIARGAGRLLLLLAFLRVMFIALYQLFSTPAGSPATRPGLGVGGAVIGLVGITLLGLGIAALFGRRLPLLLAAIVFGLELAWVLVRIATPGAGVIIQVLVIVHLAQCWKRMRPRSATPSLAAVFD